MVIPKLKSVKIIKMKKIISFCNLLCSIISRICFLKYKKPLNTPNKIISIILNLLYEKEN